MTGTTAPALSQAGRSPLPPAIFFGRYPEPGYHFPKDRKPRTRDRDKRLVSGDALTIDGCGRTDF